MKSMEGYGFGPHMCRLLSIFLDHQEVVTRNNWYHKPHLNATKGTTQGGLILPTLFNLIMDNVVRNWLALMVKDQIFDQ